MTYPHQVSAVFIFIQECDTDKNFGRKMSQKHDHSMMSPTAKDVIAGPRYTRLQKIILFFPLQSLLCRFKIIIKKKKVDSQRLGKNRQIV